MAITLQQVIDGARNRHAGFHKTRVPDTVLATHLNDVQRMLITEGAELDASRVATTCAVVFATDPSNAPGQVGAGVGGGLPADPTAAGVLVTADGNTGAAVVLDTDDAAVLVADTVVLSATTITVRLFGVAWAVNQLVGQVAKVMAGTGTGQKRIILANTVDTLTISTGTDNQQWELVPDPTSLVRVVAKLLAVDESVSLLTQVPPRIGREGYLIRLNAQGQPYLDIASPLAVQVDAGIPLPPHERVLGGSVRLTATSGLDPLTAPLSIRTYRDRYAWGPTYTVWFENGQLFLSGALADWVNVQSIDLRLVPIPPDFGARTDLFLLPDLSRPILIAEAALHCAERCAGLPDVSPPVDVVGFRAYRDAAFANFQKAIGASRRAVAKYIHESW